MSRYRRSLSCYRKKSSSSCCGRRLKICPTQEDILIKLLRTIPCTKHCSYARSNSSCCSWDASDNCATCESSDACCEYDDRELWNDACSPIRNRMCCCMNSPCYYCAASDCCSRCCPCRRGCYKSIYVRCSDSQDYCDYCNTYIGFGSCDNCRRYRCYYGSSINIPTQGTICSSRRPICWYPEYYEPSCSTQGTIRAIRDICSKTTRGTCTTKKSCSCPRSHKWYSSRHGSSRKSCSSSKRDSVSRKSCLRNPVSTRSCIKSSSTGDPCISDSRTKHTCSSDCYTLESCIKGTSTADLYIAESCPKSASANFTPSCSRKSTNTHFTESCSRTPSYSCSLRPSASTQFTGSCSKKQSSACGSAKPCASSHLTESCSKKQPSTCGSTKPPDCYSKKSVAPSCLMKETPSTRFADSCSRKSPTNSCSIRETASTRFADSCSKRTPTNSCSVKQSVRATGSCGSIKQVSTDFSPCSSEMLITCGCEEECVANAKKLLAIFVFISIAVAGILINEIISRCTCDLYLFRTCRCI